MQISGIKDRLDRLSSSYDEFKSNSEQINNTLNEYKARVHKLELRNTRPTTSISTNNDNEYKSAFGDYLRKGNEKGVLGLSQKSLSGASNNEGGYLLDDSMYRFIAKNLETNSVMRLLSSKQEISTDSFDVIEDTGGFSYGWVAESEARPETGSANIKKKTIRAHEIYAQPKVTQKLIDDSRIDIAKWLSEQLANKFMEAENHAFINGDGKNKPRGILTYSANEVEQIASAKEGQVDAESLIKLYYSLDVRYSGKAAFLMHRDVLQQIRSLKSPTTGQYLWAPGLETGAPDTLLGVPVYESADMPTPQKGALSVAIGDFSSAYMILDRAGINLMRDPYTEKPFIKFYTTKRVGGDIINTNALKLLKL